VLNQKGVLSQLVILETVMFHVINICFFRLGPNSEKRVGEKRVDGKRAVGVPEHGVYAENTGYHIFHQNMNFPH